MVVFSGKAVTALLTVVLLSLCFPATAQPTEEKETKAGKRIRIVAFGDSLVSGYTLKEQAAFPAQLESWLKRYGYPVEVINAGVDGETTKQGLARIRTVLDEPPDLVILVLGANDMLKNVPTDKTEQNLDRILHYLTEADIPVVLAGMRAIPQKSPAYAKRFNAIYLPLASKYEVEFFPFFLEGVAGSSRLTLRDRVHPNEMGVRVIAHNITPHLFRVMGWDGRPGG